ncbi:HET domain containing protein [Hyaloscypha variabilis]
MVNFAHAIHLDYDEFPLDFAREEIRLLRVYPAYTGSPLECELETYSLNNCPPYEPLSYTWGDLAAEKIPILCNGKRLDIFPNLYAALKALRPFELPPWERSYGVNQESRLVWADAICINQADLNERKEQVLIMEKIYRQGIETLIWLGSSDYDAMKGFELLKTLVKVKTLQEENSDERNYVDLGMKGIQEYGLPNFLSSDFHRLSSFLRRPWFTRVWIIQELAVAPQATIHCGHLRMPWTEFVTAINYGAKLGIPVWNRTYMLRHFLDSSSASGRVDICKSIIDLTLEKSFYEGHEDSLSLFELLVATRYAQCYDSRDKIYGLLAVCRNNDRTAARTSYAPDFTAAELYRDMTFHHLAENLGGLRLTSVLTSVDHDSPDLPSWVPDWRRPRETTALGYSTSAQSIYNPNGRFQPKIGQVDYTLNSQKKNELQAQGIFFDTLIKASKLYIDPDLTYLNPPTNNRTLLEFFRIASQLQHYPAPNTIFSAFWHTLVAGKDASGRLKCPSSFAEIISLFLDESTGQSPSLPGQTYSARQQRPKGKGRLELVNLASRTAGKTFQEVRTAMKLAVKNRKLGITEKGYLGLFPRHTEVGDGLYVLSGCHVPFLLREVDGLGRFRLVGECYVHGIMDGEVVGGEDVSMGKIILV